MKIDVRVKLKIKFAIITIIYLNKHRIFKLYIMITYNTAKQRDMYMFPAPKPDIK